MQSTPLSERVPASELDVGLFDLSGLLGRLADLNDPRKAKGLRYALAPVLLLMILAKLAGEDRPSGMADWIRHWGPLLREVLVLPWRRMPHHNTYRRLLERVIPPAELDALVSAHLRSLSGVGQSIVIALDGKTIRGTMDRENPKGDHLLCAYLPAEGIVLMQVAVGEKKNEISEAPRLLKSLDLRGKVLVADALHTQRALSLQILAAGGDYLFFAKENQPTLHEEIETLFTADNQTVRGGRVEHDFRTARTLDKGHGRLETREITVSSELQGYSTWPGLEQVFCLVRRRVELKNGKKACETVYGLTSLTAAEASPARLLGLIRSYWGIENGLHYRRDVTFQEDRTRQTRGWAGQVMATLNNLVIGLLSHAGATNIAAARRACAATLILSFSPMTPSQLK